MSKFDNVNILEGSISELFFCMGYFNFNFHLLI